MDEILQTHLKSLSLYEAEYQGTDLEYDRIKAQRERLEQSCNDVKKLIAKREDYLHSLSSTGANLGRKSGNGEMPKEDQSGLDGHTPPAAEDEGELLADITPDMFADMKLIEAVIKLLHLVKIPQSTRQICDALLQGGYQTTAGNFADTVRSTLKQYLHPNGPMLWLDNKWELKEWVPNS